MTKTLVALVPLLAVLVLAPAAMAEDLIDPPWELPDPAGTWQVWEFSTSDQENVPADDYENPYGEPLLTMSPVDSFELYGTEPGWDLDYTTWHVGGDDPASHSIQIHNKPSDGIRKEVWVQVTSSTPPISVGGQPGHGATTTPGTALPLGTDPSGLDWAVNPYLVTFPGNPSMEYIEIWFEPCTWIEEIVIHTRCVPIPEPGVMALLGLAGLVLLRKKKK